MGLGRWQLDAPLHLSCLRSILERAVRPSGVGSGCLRRARQLVFADQAVNIRAREIELAGGLGDIPVVGLEALE